MEPKKQAALINLANIIDCDIDQHINRLCFRESLIITKFESNDQVTPNPVGGMCLDIQSGLNNKFVVYLSTKFQINDDTGESKISAWVDPYFRTIEEKRRESLVGKHIDTQSLYFGYQKDHLLVIHEGNDNKKTKKKYPLTAVTGLVGEGSNFIIMRLLASCLYKGTFEISTFYINGDLCRNVYICDGPCPADINKVKMEVCRIQRMIVEECGIIHHCATLLTTDGHIVNQQWKGCVYGIQLNPLLDPVALAITEATCGCQNEIPLVFNWENDVELMSEYLDRRKLCEYNANNYVDDNPELRDLLADYIKNLLHNKPEKVLQYSLEYFMRFDNS